ncbi:MAG: chromate resistance protein [Nitrospira sp.]|nr:chromate resistance protein [Nitrospira sp.]
MTYVTRPFVHVDRCSSAWLIRRFIDPAATFVFAEEGQMPLDAIPFDLTGSAWGHQNGKCAFEVLLELHGLNDPILKQIGDIIHGADIIEDFDSSLESPGIDLAFRAIRLSSASDQEAIDRGCQFMDGLYAAIKEGYRR